MDQKGSIDITAFNKLLAETRLWCGSRASLVNPKYSLRAIAMNSTADLSRMNQDQIKQIAENLFQERRRLLRSENIDLSKNKTTGGRLLICYPEESVWDGAAEAASQEFFDVADIPAWDTWCYYGVEQKRESILFIVSWVPPDFIELAQTGIDVNPVECIQWASRIDSEFTRSLKAEGLLF